MCSRNQQGTWATMKTLPLRMKVQRPKSMGSPWCQLGLTYLALMAVSWVARSSTSSAFTSAPLEAALGGKLGPSIFLGSPIKPATPREVRKSSVGARSAASSWTMASCAMLLCSMVCRSRSSRVRPCSGVKSRDCRVVACQAASGGQYALPDAVQRCHQPPCQSARAICFEPDSALPCRQPAPSAPAPHAAPPPVHPTSGVPSEDLLSVCLPKPAASHRRAKAAIRVGGSRRSRPWRARHRSPSGSMRSGRAARRSLGARLQSGSELPRALKASYDPSRLRTKVQVGLRVERQKAHSEHHREIRTPSTMRGLSVQSDVLLASCSKSIRCRQTASV